MEHVYICVITHLIRVCEVDIGAFEITVMYLGRCLLRKLIR